MNSAKNSPAQTPTAGPRLLATSRNWISAQREYWLDYVIIFSVFIVVYVAVVLTNTQYYPDSAHYVAMSLWFSGWSQQDALDFVYQAHVTKGYEPNETIEQLYNWGLVKPRVVLPALAVPFMWAFGPNGLAVTTGVITAILIFALYKFLSGRFGRLAAVVSVLLMQSSMLIMVFNVGMLTESLSALWGVAALAAAYRYRNDRRRIWIVAMVVVTLLSAFTRQATFVVAGAFVLAWLLSLIIRRAERGWAVPAIAVAGTSLVAQVIQTALWPFSQGDQYMRMTGTNNLWEAILATPGLIRGILVQEFVTYASEDQVLFIIIVLSLISMIIFWRRAESHLLFGALLGIALYNITNGNATSFRYAVPGIVFFLASISVLVVHLGSLTRQKTDALEADPAVS